VVFWRICRKARAKTAFDGEGARRNPGRWNHKDIAVVYCASSLSLATLEYFVHLDPEDMPDDLVAIRAELHDSVIVERVDPKTLPTNWRKCPPPATVKDLGSAWVASLRTLALVVPSAITPSEDNIVLNPRHVDMAKIARDPPEPFAFDPRLRK
jgi:RES domain-containing protein